MVLVIDVGNTNTVIGLMEGREVVHTFRVTTLARTTDESGLLFLQLLGNRGIGADAVDGAIISSVVPSVLFNLEKACRAYLDVEALVVGRKLKTGVKIRMDNPREVGADRIVNTVAAFDRWGGPVIVVDFGTATTFDCIRADGSYLGGVIAPGYQISAEALFKRTSKLPRVEPARPAKVIGRNTVHSMQSGLYFGYLELVDGICRRIQDEMGHPPPKVLATGGLARFIARGSTTIGQVEEDLTLLGLKLLWERNQS